ncbi:hypothetical protein BU16DRAFT_526258 [Lophium mytilinum]|uniref:Uncharacterized protein n=1 Tax=Lophium mytilinum TaxID=390894 RepID=A0A6A6QXQ6_9PEZI|nr:hypothetical protein BU16DRAFT_526258 [Lophium mytilinum]
MASTLQSGSTAPSATPATHELSFPLPRAPQSHIHLRLTNHTTSVLLFLTTSVESTSTLSSLGSFVYAMPNRTGGQPLSTPLYTQGSTLDFATRLARLLAKKLGKPVYVGNSISFAGAGMGGTVEEEMEGFRRCVDVVVGVLERDKKAKE